MYEIIEHTADTGIAVEGSSLEELFVNAADALFDITISKRGHAVPSIDVPLSVDAESVEQLLVHWLQDLLFIFESRRLVLSNFWIDEVDENHVVGSAKGVKFDSTKHSQKLDIKAVTYHQLEVGCGDDGVWRARVIFDI